MNKLIVLLFLFAQAAWGTTLESGCQQLNVSNGEFKTLAPANCMSEKFKKYGTAFIVKGFEASEFFSVHYVDSENIFCEMTIDKIFHTKGSTFKEIWNSEKKFKELVQKTTYVDIIKLNTALSTSTKKVCDPFPAFKRIIKIPGNEIPSELGELKQGVFIVLAKKATTIFFFTRDFNKIAFSMNMPHSITIIDALTQPNGELLLITKENIREKNPIYCLEYWDMMSGFQLKADCSIEKTDSQILVRDNQKILRLYQGNSQLSAKELSGKKNFWSVKKPETFNLMNSFLD